MRLTNEDVAVRLTPHRATAGLIVWFDHVKHCMFGTKEVVGHNVHSCTCRIMSRAHIVHLTRRL